ncbi:hypothetical protein SLA2020_040750 [Shorea laevis]
MNSHRGLLSHPCRHSTVAHAQATSCISLSLVFAGFHLYPTLISHQTKIMVFVTQFLSIDLVLVVAIRDS